MTTKQLAGCVIADESGRVLLIHRNTPKLVQWELPGGKVEPSETFAQTAEREVLEEIGVKVTASNEIGSTKFDDDGNNWEYHWFMAESIDGKPAVMEPDKFDDIAYFNLLDSGLARGVALSPNIVNFIAYLDNNKLKLKKL